MALTLGLQMPKLPPGSATALMENPQVRLTLPPQGERGTVGQVAPPVQYLYTRIMRYFIYI